jgi:hypothetical protein
LACLAFLAATAIFGGGGTARGAIITQYAFTGATLNRSATTVDGNVTAGNITDSPTVNGNATSVLIRTNGVGYPSEVLSAARANFNESSVRANVFFTFTVSPNAGMELDLSSLTFNVAQGGGTASTRLRSPLKRRQLRDEPYQTSCSSRPFVPPSHLCRLPYPRRRFRILTAPVTFQVHFFTPGVSQNVDFDDITLNGPSRPCPNRMAWPC